MRICGRGIAAAEPGAVAEPGICGGWTFVLGQRGVDRTAVKNTTKQFVTAKRADPCSGSRGRRMNVLAILLLVGISAEGAFAQNSKAYAVCSNGAKTQAEMNECASAEASRADK